MLRSDRLDEIHDTLTHLYETQYLQTHPLADELAADVAPALRGQALHARVRAAIERLRPAAGTPEHALAWRQYRCLTLRHVHALTFHQVANDLGLTERHCRRVHKEALASLRDTLLTAASQTSRSPAATTPSARPGLLEDELTRVGTVTEPMASLCETIRGTVQTLDALARSAGVSLVIVAEAADDAAADRVVVRQIVLNVLVHLIHAQPGARIEIASRSNGTTAAIDVAVWPPAGMAPASAIGRADEEHLAIARRLAQLRGVGLRLDHQPAGVRVTAVFQRAMPGTVLLIDDNADLLRLFRRYAMRGGYRVLEATSAEEALRLAQVDRPDVIVLDVLMPHQDGWETLQFLKNHRLTGHIPVVICSVLHDQDLALSLGASSFLSKPVGQAALLDTLQGLTSNAQALSDRGRNLGEPAL